MIEKIFCCCSIFYYDYYFGKIANIGNGSWPSVSQTPAIPLTFSSGPALQSEISAVFHSGNLTFSLLKCMWVSVHLTAQTHFLPIVLLYLPALSF